MRKTSDIIWQDAQHQVLFDILDMIREPGAGRDQGARPRGPASAVVDAVRAERHHARMRERSEHPQLPAQGRQPSRVAHGDRLDGDGAFGTAGAPDSAHAALSQTLEELVRTDAQ